MRSLLGDEEGVALVAVGGYGRRELCPASDLDLVLVHNGKRTVQSLAERVWYPIWDARVGLDHSVRTVKEAAAVTADDMWAALGLLDGRVVACDAVLGEELIAKVRAQWRAQARRRLPALHDAVKARHREFGEVAFLLEPDLKEGRGGLRDGVVLRAAAAALPALDLDRPALVGAEEVLLRARVELHRITGRATDRLSLEEQDGVATAAGYRDADELMAAVAEAARAVAWHGDDAWRRLLRALAGPSGREVHRERVLAPALVVRDGELAVLPDADLGDPSLVLRAAAVAAHHGLPFAPDALVRLQDAAGPGDPWPPAARDALVALLGAGHAAIPVLEAIDQHGVLVRILPEWDAVRSRPQRNAYHRFTVDRHLCETAANAAGHARDVARPDLLLVGAWLHDIGKGFPGDHTEAGMVVMERVATRMGFRDGDVRALVQLVEHHLLLPDAATRRDLDDPATIEAVAASVGDEDTLDLLVALTTADSEATGPAAWGSWKAQLVADLAGRVRTRLAGRRLPAPVPGPTPAQAALAQGALPAVLVDGSTVTVVARDRPGVFSRVAGALALNGLDVRSASAASCDDGTAVEVFEVDPTTMVDAGRVQADVERALAGRLAVEARLRDRARAYGWLPKKLAAHAADPRVLFDNEASGTATVVEVRAPDSIGLLYRVTRALSEADLDVRVARVVTLGHEVVDVFYVTGPGGEKITDGEHLAEIERALLAAVAG